MILVSFAEVISIGAVLPFLGALTAPEQVFVNAYVQPLVQFFALDEPKQLLLPLTVIFSVAALVSGVMRLILLWAKTRLGHAIGADLSVNIYRRTLYQPYSVHLIRNSSEVISGISSKANNVVSSTVMPILTIISSCMLLLTILIALIVIDPGVAFVTIFSFGIVYAAIILLTKTHLKRDGQRISNEQNQVIKALQEGLGGIRDVLIDGSQNIYCEIFRGADLRLRRAVANVEIISGSPRYAVEALGMVLIAVLAYLLTEQSEKVGGAIPILGALALGAQRLLPILQQAYSSWSSMSGGLASLSDVVDLLDQSLPEYVNRPVSEAISFQSHIVFNDLGFRYAEQGPWVLKGFNLVIPKGSCVGFFGSTGSGKSTLLDLVMGLLVPSEGHLSIDGVTVTSKNYRSWQAQIAHVPQDVYLSDKTIAENIAFGIPLGEIDFDRLDKAANQAQIAGAIEKLDEKYSTMVGEQGVRLSGGQRQRIGIARALYKQASVIVFDEATSALDSNTESSVMKAIECLSNDLTILIVAHRLTTLKNCSEVVELENGNILRKGSYQKIVNPDV
jgi:ATP-binding cassette, subfamily B, bacterial PglK